VNGLERANLCFIDQDKPNEALRNIEWLPPNCIEKQAHPTWSNVISVSTTRLIKQRQTRQKNRSQHNEIKVHQISSKGAKTLISARALL